MNVIPIHSNVAVVVLQLMSMCANVGIKSLPHCNTNVADKTVMATAAWIWKLTQTSVNIFGHNSG